MVKDGAELTVPPGGLHEVMRQLSLRSQDVGRAAKSRVIQKINVITKTCTSLKVKSRVKPAGDAHLSRLSLRKSILTFTFASCFLEPIGGESSL